MTDEQLEYAFRWCRRPDGNPDLKQDSFAWQLNFRELGIVSYLGVVNHKVARLARDFIWTDPARAPDYFALKAHLEPHLPKQERPAARSSSKPLPKAARDKLKKRRRKAGRVRRRE